LNDVRYPTLCGLKPDIAACPKSANSGSRGGLIDYASYGHVPTLDEAKAVFTLVLIAMNASPRMLILDSAAYPHRLIFWFFCNVISPHKQGSFDFSRTRLAFLRDLPD
jgi:hypothetical protein